MKWTEAKTAAVGRNDEKEDEEASKGAVFQSAERAAKGDRACRPRAAVSFKSVMVKFS